MSTLSVALDTGEYLMKSAIKTYEVRNPNGTFLGVVHEEPDGWRVPTYPDSPVVCGTFASAEDAVACLVKYMGRPR